MVEEFDEYKSDWPTVVDKPQLTIRDGFPIEYSCENELKEVAVRRTLPEALWFIFDYEVTLKDDPLGAFPADIRRAFEWSLLWNLAIEVGLNNCSLDSQYLKPGQRLRSLSQNGFQVVALGSQQDDVVDTEPAGKVHFHLAILLLFCGVLTIFTLVALESNIFGGICFSKDPYCIPIKGIMNAKYIGDEMETQQYLREMVEKVLRTNSILVDRVASVLYVGDRSTFHKPFLYQPIMPQLVTDSESNQDDSRMESSRLDAVIGSVAGIAVVSALLVGLFVTRFFQKKSAGKECAKTRMSFMSNEFEAGSLDTTEVCIEDMPPTACDVDTFVDEEEPSRCDKPEEQDNTITGIPPLAPKSVSLQTKRRRRRKKKKKQKKNVMVLTRSNSANSMDTIAEEDEEDQGDGDVSEDGSDYSTDDEDQGCHLKRSTSLDSLSSDLFDWDFSHSQPLYLEEIVESPKIRKLPPPPV